MKGRIPLKDILFNDILMVAGGKICWWSPDFNGILLLKKSQRVSEKEEFSVEFVGVVCDSRYCN